MISVLSPKRTLTSEDIGLRQKRHRYAPLIVIALMHMVAAGTFAVESAALAAAAPKFRARHSSRVAGFASRLCCCAPRA